MRISILLTTNNREEDCMLCLDRLLIQKTNDIEIILLNDWHIETNNLKNFCKDRGIEYIHTGSQKNNQYLWRVPGFALNIGVRNASANYIIIGNAEIFQVDQQCVEKMYNNKKIITSPNVLGQLSRDNFNSFKPYKSTLPFFWGFPKQPFIDIGGYDEDYIGVSFEDTDLSERMRSILRFEIINSQVIHLWNTEKYYQEEVPRVHYNADIYAMKKDGKAPVIRNQGKYWGAYI